jgi:group I intron endonuclease
MLTVFGEIYVVTCMVNGKRYVGQTTVGVETRWQRHLKRKGHAPCFGQALAKYGAESFSVEVVDTAGNQTDLNEREKYWIRLLNTITPHGYNLTEGGEGGKPTAETREKMRQAKLGTKASPETRAKMSLARKGRKQSQETIEKIRAKNIGRKNTTEARLRMQEVKSTPEAKEKARINATGRSPSLEAREKMRQARLAYLKDTTKRKTPIPL